MGRGGTIRRFTGRHDPVCASFRYEWDYLGRLQEVRCPDEEVVPYGCDDGGRIATVSGYHNGYSEVEGLGPWTRGIGPGVRTNAC